MADPEVSQNVILSHLNELPVLHIKNKSATASIALQGAHVYEYQPHGQKPMLFVSDEEPFKKGSAIRGGIPICWPWFGAHPDGAKHPEYPSHGFARTTEWEWEVLEDGEERTDIRLWMETDGKNPAFPFPVLVELLVCVDQNLSLSLTTNNLGSQPFTLTQAMHTYFSCNNIADVQLHNLEGYTYYDSLSLNQGAITDEFRFDREIDWVVLDDGQPVGFGGLGHWDINMRRKGSNSLVIWNPWIEKSKTLSHFREEEYKQMFCVEATNTSEDSRIVLPEGSQTLCLSLEYQEPAGL
ncbi:D-hexose-6-phosphate mutarotase [Parendozoicomonas haliclonae]|uniref:Putative glucose-6-phosphate 1-epimerase n=1 Tax=Parendozoicomonas haliclonae TaxID=1960125 RepID=A0A1X7AGH6_9GAMM|nr:D-hexose-6-phosphate mutarotase [Parendozoicomonas haliclonae]SMA40042.1 putative glucose-6-phosphate 1-epimerase [Parendozoicomonas haliclonae]